MATTLKVKEPKKTMSRTPRRSPNDPEELATTVTDGGIEIQPGVQPAYVEYLKARKGLESAFRGRVFKDQEAFEVAQRQYKYYQQSMDKAIAARERAESEALETYQRAIAEAVKVAGEEYLDSIRQAMVTCMAATEEAWKGSMETSVNMTSFFQNDEIVVTKQETTQTDPARESGMDKTRRRITVWGNNFTSFFRQGARMPGRLYAGIARNGH